jgi:hypothetical protein
VARIWTCRGCGEKNPRIKQKCSCGRKRPVRKTAAEKALKEGYEAWVLVFGETCNICGRAPSERRRLDRDHDHATLKPRGLLCARCNRSLPTHVTVEWMRKALAYLERAEKMSEDLARSDDA